MKWQEQTGSSVDVGFIMSHLEHQTLTRVYSSTPKEWVFQ